MSEYKAGKMGERKWGVFFHYAGGSHGPKAVHATKKAAERDAARRNWCERELAKEREAS